MRDPAVLMRVDVSVRPALPPLSLKKQTTLTYRGDKTSYQYKNKKKFP